MPALSRREPCAVRGGDNPTRTAIALGGGGNDNAANPEHADGASVLVAGGGGADVAGGGVPAASREGRGGRHPGDATTNIGGAFEGGGHDTSVHPEETNPTFVGGGGATLAQGHTLVGVVAGRSPRDGDQTPSVDGSVEGGGDDVAANPGETNPT